jgi:uncharacterized phage-associated protein
MRTAAQKVADYIISFFYEYGDAITNLKLQKLMYYAQAWHLAIFDKPLFEGDFEAWVHGPVHMETYQRFKGYRWDPITENIEKPKLPKETVDFLNEVLDVYGSFSAYQLELLTHEEAPWRRARGGIPIDQESRAVISPEDMKEFYRERLHGKGKAK